jgi:hypothetical protein
MSLEDDEVGIDELGTIAKKVIEDVITPDLYFCLKKSILGASK